MEIEKKELNVLESLQESLMSKNKEKKESHSSYHWTIYYDKSLIFLFLWNLNCLLNIFFANLNL